MGMGGGTGITNNPWSLRKKLTTGILTASLLGGFGYSLHRYYNTYYNKDNTSKLIQDTSKQDDEKQALEVIVDCKYLQIEALKTKNKSVYDLYYTKDEADKIVGKFKSIVDNATKTESKKDDQVVKATGYHISDLFKYYGVRDAENKDYSVIVRSEVSRLGKIPVDLSKIPKEEIQKGQEIIAQANKILDYVNKLDTKEENTGKDLVKYRNDLMQLLKPAMETSSYTEDNEVVNNALDKITGIMQEIKGRQEDKLQYGNLEERIFTKKITPEEFKQMTQDSKGPFYELHKAYGGDMQKLVRDMSNSLTLEWYIEQLNDVDNWTAWKRSDAASSAFGGRKLELLYITGYILSNKDKNDER